MKRVVVLAVVALSVSLTAQIQNDLSLEVRGKVPKALSLDATSWEKLPRSTVTATNGHDHTKASYEGVLLRDLLTAAGVPAGEELRGKAVATYIKIHARDGYDAVIALPEIDPSFTDQKVLLADTMNGKRLDAKQGPLKLIVPNDKRPARWVRMVAVIEVASAE